MPRTSRASGGGFVDHVRNRCNGRSDVFHKKDDFASIVSLMGEGSREGVDAANRELSDDKPFPRAVVAA